MLHNVEVPKIVDHAQRRDEVAAVAAHLFASAGIDGSTIRDVAAAGGWSTTMVTHYFATKDELLLHTLASSVAQGAADIIDAQRSGTDALRAIIEQTLPLDEVRAFRWRLWLTFWGRAIGSDALTEIQRERQEELVRSFAAALRDRPGNDDRAARSLEARRLAALLDGVSIQAVFAPDLWSPEQQLAHFSDVLTAVPG